MDLGNLSFGANRNPEDNANNYQPVIATGDKAVEIIENMREYSSSLSDLRIDDEGNLSII
ncbi:MAG: hypothetical protein E7283_08070 [Lachnospiraceae bacterium]|nr:hypothetical protein [Lachnospiraceae bacterium]